MQDSKLPDPWKALWRGAPPVTSAWTCPCRRRAMLQGAGRGSLPPSVWPLALAPAQLPWTCYRCSVPRFPRP